MKRSLSIYINSLIFIFFFATQQVISFVWVKEDINSPYWLIIYFLLLVIALRLPIRHSKYKMAYTFMLCCSLGEILTLLNGKAIGQSLLYALYPIFAIGGFAFVVEKKLNGKIFNVLIPFLYIFFYLMYFQFRELNVELQEEGDLFGHSSSNTIAISLNFVLWIYYFLDTIQNHKNIKWVLLFAVINFFLIVIQSSRAGLAVSALLVMLVVYDFSKKSLSVFVKLLIIVFIILLAGKSVQYYDDIQDYSEASGISTFEADEDVRLSQQKAFLLKMDAMSFILGYSNNDKVFKEGGRSFNAFLDFWNRYGLLPFLFLLYLTGKRIIERKKYTVNIYVYSPIMLYAFAETIWAATLWDFFLYLFLFYSYKKT